MRIFLTIALLLISAIGVSAQSISKLAEFKRGPVFEADVSHINPRSDQMFVVGLVNSRRNLMVLVYKGTETEPRSEIELGRASSVSVSPIGNPNDGQQLRFVTAMRDSDGKLRLIAWSVDSSGRSLALLDRFVGPAINQVDIANEGFGGLRVVAERANGNLTVRRFTLSDDDQLTFWGAENYGRVKALSLEAGSIGGLAMQIGDDTLRVTSFTTGGSSGVQRGGTNTGAAVSDLGIVALDDVNAGSWVTITNSPPVSTSDFRPNHCVGAPIVIPFGPVGRPKLIAWQKEDIFSNELDRGAEREFTTRQGLAHEVAIARQEDTRSRFVTGHLGYSKPCGLKPRLELHLWELDEDDGFNKLATTDLRGDYRGLAMSRFGVGSSSKVTRLVTVMHGRVDRDLKIAVWEATGP